MAETAISFGTQIWLAELKRSGWLLTVSERSKPAPSVGVLATALEDGHEGSGVFVPCASETDALNLLERVEREVEA